MLTDAEIEAAKGRTAYTAKPHHEHNDCIRMAYQWLDAQNQVKVAKKRHLPRVVGHQRGVEAVRKLVRAVRSMGLEALTLYAFSTENWRRPEDEISALMGLLKRFILSDLEEFAADNVRLKIIGNYKALPADVVELIEGAIARTAQRHSALRL